MFGPDFVLGYKRVSLTLHIYFSGKNLEKNDDVEIYFYYLYISIHMSTTILAKPSDVNILSTQLLCVFVYLCTSR